MKKKVWVLALMMLAVRTLLATAQDDAAVFELAERGVTSNDEWQPFIQEFDDVEMVLVPAGTFMMGTNDEQHDAVLQECLDPEIGTALPEEQCHLWADREQPANEQTIEKPFWIDRFEVTNEQVGSVATGNDSFGSNCRSASSQPDEPHVCVTWSEAREFCESRGSRLPTEVEWEYAARGPDGLVYPWGDEFDRDKVEILMDANDRLSPVGSYPDGASWVGALDMSSNVFEWTSTIWGDVFEEAEFPYPYDAHDGREDPNRIDIKHVVRSGTWEMPNPIGIQAFWRGAFPSDGDIKGIDVGFRCARDYD